MLLAMRNVGVLGVPHRFEARVRKLVDEHFQRHAVLQAHRDAVPMVSIRPPMVLPSLAMVMNSSPGGRLRTGRR